jgi:ABC-type proline/glycine betaine transport system permease subunit
VSPLAHLLSFTVLRSPSLYTTQIVSTIPSLALF